MAKISSTHLFWFFHCPIMCAALMCAGIVVAECFEARGRSLRIITASGGPSSAHGGKRGVAIKASAQDLHQLPGHRQHHDHCNFYNHQLEDLCQVDFTITTTVIVNRKPSLLSLIPTAKPLPDLSTETTQFGYLTSGGVWEPETEAL